MIERNKCKEVGDKDGSYDKTMIGGVGQTRQSETINVIEDVATPFLTAETPMHMQGNETPMQFAGDSTPFVGGETPRSQNDDIWKVNDNDKDRFQQQSVAYTNNDVSNLSGAANGSSYTSSSQYQITYQQWEKHFIMQIMDGPNQGRHGVLYDSVDADGYTEIALIANDGNTEDIRTRYHHTSLILAEIKNGAQVTILHGDPRVIGLTGRCAWISDSDVMIDVNMNQHMAKRAHCAVVFTDDNH